MPPSLLRVRSAHRRTLSRQASQTHPFKKVHDLKDNSTLTELTPAAMHRNTTPAQLEQPEQIANESKKVPLHKSTTATTASCILRATSAGRYGKHETPCTHLRRGRRTRKTTAALARPCFISARYQHPTPVSPCSHWALEGLTCGSQRDISAHQMPHGYGNRLAVDINGASVQSVAGSVTQESRFSDEAYRAQLEMA